MSIQVVDAGVLSSVQDAVGRRSWRHVGVPTGGAADAWSARLANRLVGNDDEAGLLEMTLRGATLRFEAPALIALAGSLGARLDGFRIPREVSIGVRAGATLEVATGDGLRGYLAVAGGISVPEVLGSRATDLRTGFGGYEGRALRPGDRLGFGVASDGRRRRWVGHRHHGPIRIVPGPHADSVPAGALEETSWVVGPEADRAGVRLDGQPLDGQPLDGQPLDGRRVAVTSKEVPSMGLPLGAIQLPGDGRPIIMLADGPVTGGYPVPAVVIRADVGRVAQLRPGDAVAFASVSLGEALEADRRAVGELAAIELLPEPDDDELAWIGSLE